MSFFSQLQSLSVVILDPRKIKSVTVFIVSPCMCHEVMKLDAIILVFFFNLYVPHQSHSKEMKWKKEKWLSEATLQIT